MGGVREENLSDLRVYPDNKCSVFTISAAKILSKYQQLLRARVPNLAAAESILRDSINKLMIDNLSRA